MIELMISAGIVTILIFGLFQTMDVGQKLLSTGDVSGDLRQEIIKVFTAMDREFKEIRPTTSSQLSLGVGTSNSTITFKIPQVVNGTIYNFTTGNVTWGDDIRYTRDSSNRQITRTDVNTNVTTIIANNINSLTFTRPATPADILQIDITAGKNATAMRAAQNDTGQIFIRMRN